MKIELEKIATETRNESTANIDKMTTIEILKAINDEDKKVAYAVEKELPNIEKAVEVIYQKLVAGGRLIYCGAGTSGRLGVLDAVECPPTFGVSPDFVKAIMAGGPSAFVKAVEGAEDNKTLGASDLIAAGFTESDVLVGIAASGRTPYVIGCMEYAKKIGAPVISLSCSLHSEIEQYADIAISPWSGPEVIAGSTRMKSGTSQKMILNMISTAVMIKLGKVYGNLMVDVQATNEKLIERTKSIVCTATGVDLNTAIATLEQCEYSAKHAILMILANVNYDQSKNLLLKHNNNIAHALEFLNNSKAI